MSTIGNVDEISDGFLWRIGDIFTLKEGEHYYTSPKFFFAGNNWALRIQRDNKIRCIYLWLGMLTTGDLIITYSISLKMLDGKKGKEHCRCDFKEVKLKHGYYRSISLPESFIKETERVPTNVFIVFCTLKHPTSIGDKNGVATAQCSYCKETLNSESIPSHEKKCINKPIKCPECAEVVALKNWYEHQCATTKAKDDVSLTQDYKKVLVDGKNHDLILKIGDKELRVHQDILRARSPVFKSMLDHDMKEKKSGVIDIPDCDPQAMEHFLSYVYTGKVETLYQSNMLGLYYISDKYDMQCLKEDCCEFIKKSLSTTNICGVIQLELYHSDTVLLEYATQYFMSNSLDILRTVEWQLFLKDNLTVGNELLIKSFEKF